MIFLVLSNVNFMKKYKLELKLVPLLLPSSLNNEYSLTFGQLCEVVSKPIILWYADQWFFLMFISNHHGTKLILPNVAGHISVYLKWQAYESKIMWKIVFSWTVIFLSASSNHSKSKLIHGYIQQWCHINKMPKRLDQSFGYMLKS